VTARGGFSFLLPRYFLSQDDKNSVGQSLKNDQSLPQAGVLQSTATRRPLYQPQSDALGSKGAAVFAGHVVPLFRKLQVFL
jgi:hypothetical protein